MNHITIILIMLSGCTLAATMHCPSSVKMDLTQKGKAVRPAGTVQFTANVQGVSIDNIMYYRWNIREFNYPLYTFSKSLNISQTSYLHDDMVVNESHDFQDGIVSHLNVTVDTARRYKYVFLLHTMDNKICKIHTKPKFKGPTIDISVSNSNISCCVHGAVGNPSLTLRMKTESGYIHDLSTSLEHPANHNSGDCCVYKEGVNVPDDCQLTCKIADKLGHYTEKRRVGLSAAPPVMNSAQARKMSHEQYVVSAATSGWLWTSSCDTCIKIIVYLYLFSLCVSLIK